jgi:hypothetical protein
MTVPAVTPVPHGLGAGGTQGLVVTQGFGFGAGVRTQGIR